MSIPLSWSEAGGTVPERAHKHFISHDCKHHSLTKKSQLKHHKKTVTITAEILALPKIPPVTVLCAIIWSVFVFPACSFCSFSFVCEQRAEAGRRICALLPWAFTTLSRMSFGPIPHSPLLRGFHVEWIDVCVCASTLQRAGALYLLCGFSPISLDVRHRMICEKICTLFCTCFQLLVNEREWGERKKNTV